MFVATYTSKRQSKTSTSTFLVESFRNEQGQSRHRRLVNISHLPPEKIRALQGALQGHALVDWDALPGLEALDFGLPFLALQTLGKLDLPALVPKALASHWPTLAAMIVNRLDDPRAKYGIKYWLPRTATARLLGQTSPAFVHHDACYETLDRLHEAQITVEDALFAQRSSPPTLFLYDLTSTYFEGSKAELGAYGYSRDHRSDLKQITIGFLGDSDGLPIAVEVFEGNTRDCSTVAAQIQKMTTRVACPKACFVGDRGMMTVDNAALLREQGLDFILALTHWEVLGLVETHGPKQLGLLDERGLADITLDGRRLIVCRNPVAGADTKRRREELMGLTEARLNKLELRVKKGPVKQAATIQRALDRFLTQWSMEKFFVTAGVDGTFSWHRNEETLRAAARLDGVYGLETTQPTGALAGEKVQSIYKNLQAIEHAFECLKSELRVRPVFPWRERRIRAHVFLCTLAYLVEQTWRNAWKAWPKEERPEWEDLMGQVKAWRRGYAPGNSPLKPKDAGLTPMVAKFFQKRAINLP